jgi:hypothetical protein
VQPCGPVAVEYGGGAAKASRLFSSQAPLRFTRPSLTAQCTFSSFPLQHCAAAPSLSPAHYTLTHALEHRSAQKPAPDLGCPFPRACHIAISRSSKEVGRLRRGTASVIGSAFTAHRNWCSGMAPRDHRNYLLVPERHANSTSC